MAYSANTGTGRGRGGRDGTAPPVVAAPEPDIAQGGRVRMTGQDREPLCRCGHGHSAHRHYRRGSDCALCDCPRWRPRGRLRGLLRRRAA